MEELLTEFQSESKTLFGQLMGILESIEGDYSQYRRLEEYGQIVDRIMGAAKSLAGFSPELHDSLTMIGNYSELCKTVSYKASQVSNNEYLYTIVVALLLDATEMLEDMIDSLDGKSRLVLKEYLTATILDRLKWLSAQFAAELRASVGSTATTGQTEIDQLLKKMGF